MNARCLKGLLLLASIALTVLPANTSKAQVTISNLWNIPAGSREYVTSGNTERGIAYNHITGHVLLISRANLDGNALRVVILDRDTGAEVGFLDTTGVSGGIFPLSLGGVADDGSIYIGNLVTTSPNPVYKLYRWASETNAPVQVFSGNPAGGLGGGRWGDTFDLRGGGTNTQVLLGSQDKIASILMPTDETLNTFVAYPLDVSGITATDLSKGVAFGKGNTFYAKNTGTGNLREIQFDIFLNTATNVATHTIASGVAGISVWTNYMILGGVVAPNATTGHQLNVYDLSEIGTLPLIGTVPFPSPGTANANAVGFAEFGPDGRLYAIDTQNGILAVQILVNTNPVAPVVATQPQNTTIAQGGYGSISSFATGTKPIAVQWLFKGVEVPNATNAVLQFTNLTLAQAGEYTVRFSNLAGTTLSQPATLTVTPLVTSDILTPLWQLLPGQRHYVAADNNQRGIAVNPNTGNLLLVSRTSSNAVYVLNGETGEELHVLDLTGVTGGTFPINLIGVVEDGRTYAGNLTTASGNASNPFKLYSWIDDNPGFAPQLVWSGDPGAGQTPRWGDTMAVRLNAGTVEVLLASRNSNIVSLLQPEFSSTAANVITVPDAPAGAFGLGLAFGQGNTFWGKSADQALRLVEYDVLTGIGTVRQTYTNLPTMAVIGVDVPANLLAGIFLANPDHLRVFDISNPATEPQNVDAEIFMRDNANANGTGSVAFGINRLYALDSNNGIYAYTYNTTCIPSKLTITRGSTDIQVSWSRTGRLQSTPALIPGNTTWTEVSSTSPAAVPLGATNQFFRVVCP